MKNKKAAMEMSMGTIVTIVLLMSVLVLGLVMVKNIFGSGQKAINVVDDQLLDEVNKIYGETSKVGIYPTNQKQKISQEDSDEVGIIITNLLKGADQSKEFTYEVFVEDEGSCGISKEKLMGFITIGDAGSTILNSGEQKVKRVRFEIPSGAPFCILRYGVNVYADNDPYASTDFDLEITK